MKITTNYKYEDTLKEKLKNGDIVYMKGIQGTSSFYGIYCYGIGVIELENGSDAYAKTKD